MKRMERHNRITELLESLAINNNRLSLHEEEISVLDIEVLKKQCIALYEEILLLASPVDHSKQQETIKQEVSKELVPEVEADKPEVKEELVDVNEEPENVPVEDEPKSIHMKLQDEAEMVSLFEKFNSKPIDNISRAISISKRFEFQNNFFEGDAKEYKNFISLIDTAGDREAAFQIYHEYKSRLKWDNEELKDELKSLLYRKYAT